MSSMQQLANSFMLMRTSQGHDFIDRAKVRRKPNIQEVPGTGDAASQSGVLLPVKFWAKKVKPR